MLKSTITSPKYRTYKLWGIPQVSALRPMLFSLFTNGFHMRYCPMCRAIYVLMMLRCTSFRLLVVFPFRVRIFDRISPYYKNIIISCSAVYVQFDWISWSWTVLSIHTILHCGSFNRTHLFYVPCQRTETMNS